MIIYYSILKAGIYFAGISLNSQLSYFFTVKEMRITMHSISGKWIVVLLITTISSTVFPVDDGLKEYYEEQKTQFMESFKAPEPGSKISLTLLSGKTRTGILKELTADKVTIQTEIGLITYPKNVLVKRTRARLFAEDYAHLMASSKIRQIQTQNHAYQKKTRNSKEQEIFHCARLIVHDSLDKKLDTKSSRSTRSATEMQTYRLDITLANTTPHDDTYTLEWYFYSRSVNNKSKGPPKITDKGSKQFTVAAQKRIKYTVLAKPLVNKETRKSSSSGRKGKKKKGGSQKTSRSGMEYYGYVVLVRHNGKIIAKTSNQRALLKEENLARLNAASNTSASDSSRKSNKKKK